MSKQVYFVVAVDVDTEQVFIDDETFIARFGEDEQMWDTETLEWSEGSYNNYTKALKILNTTPIAKDGN